MSKRSIGMKMFRDKELTKPIETIDFGMVEVGEIRDLTVFIHNDKKTLLTDIEFKLIHPPSETVKIVTSPTSIQPGKTESLSLRWQPSSKFKKALKVKLAILGKEVYLAER